MYISDIINNVLDHAIVFIILASIPITYNKFYFSARIIIGDVQN